MQIGIFSNGNRNNKVAKLSYDEDLKEIIVADRLGMTEAWISEHGTFLAWQAADPRLMMREAMDLILKAWSAPEPFDWHGEVWQGEKWHIIPKPLTDIEVGIACSRTDSTIELTAEKGFLPLMSWTPTMEQVRGMIATYMSSPHQRGAKPARSRVRVGRVVYVADSVAQAKHELRDADLRHAYGRMQHLIPPGGSNADLTFERFIDNGFFICGDPDTVYQGVKRFYDDVGGFGTLLIIVGKDWATFEQRRRSMERFMAEVAPRLAAFDPDRKPALADVIPAE